VPGRLSRFSLTAHQIIALSKLSEKDPAPADDAAEGEPRPGRARKPIGWSMIVIGVLVAVSAALVYRRDGILGVTEILTSDLALFGGILPRVLAGCCSARSSRKYCRTRKCRDRSGRSPGLRDC
jgi:hypothetical protein